MTTTQDTAQPGYAAATVPAPEAGPATLAGPAAGPAIETSRLARSVIPRLGALIGAGAVAAALGSALVAYATAMTALWVGGTALWNAIPGVGDADAGGWLLVAWYVVPTVAGVQLALFGVRRRWRALVRASGVPRVGRSGRRVRPRDVRGHLAELCHSPAWAPVSAGAASEREFAGRVAAACQREVATQALGAGLACGSVSGPASRLLAAGASADLELRMLAKLGRPLTWRAGWRVLRDACCCLFADGFLEGQGRVAVRAGVHAAAAGVTAAAEVADAAADVLADFDAEDLMGGGGTVSTVLGYVFNATAGGAAGVVGVGEAGLRTIAEITGRLGDEIAEGLIVAAMVNQYGATLVADVVALDEEHRRELSPRVADFVGSSLKVVGSLVRDAGRGIRRAYLDRRAAAMRRMPEAAGTRIGKLFRKD